MEEKRSKGKEEKLGKKVSLAAAMLLFHSHRLPGVRGWELRRKLGKNYMKIIDALNSKLNEIGLKVKVVMDTESKEKDLDRARFYITLADSLSLSDIAGAGWPIDEVAILSATLSYIASRGGRAPEKEVRELLGTKFPQWKIDAALEKFSRRGYIMITEDGIVQMGWRTEVEVDIKGLLKSLVSVERSAQKTNETEGERS